MSRFELPTSSLPRKRSTPELHRLNQKESERPGSNRRHSAWKADALPTELLSLIYYLKINVGLNHKYNNISYDSNEWGEQDSNLRS